MLSQLLFWAGLLSLVVIWPGLAFSKGENESELGRLSRRFGGLGLAAVLLIVALIADYYR